MLDKLIIIPMVYTLLVFAGLLLLPRCLWLAWGRIILLKKEMRAQDLALSAPVE